jgi:hypothetical protein
MSKIDHVYSYDRYLPISKILTCGSHTQGQIYADADLMLRRCSVKPVVLTLTSTELPRSLNQFLTSKARQRQKTNLFSSKVRIENSTGLGCLATRKVGLPFGW